MREMRGLKKLFLCQKYIEVIRLTASTFKFIC